MNIKTEVYSLDVGLEHSRCQLTVQGLNRCVFHSMQPLLLVPDFAAKSVELGPPEILESRRTPGAERYVVLRAPLSGELSGWIENRLYCLRGRIVCTGRYLVGVDHSLAHWQVLGEESRLGMPSVHAYIGEPKTYLNGKVLPTEDLEVSTASHNYDNWNCLPRLMFTDGNVTAGVGGTSIAHDYGLEVKTDEDRCVEHARFNYGGAAAPHPGDGGRVQRGPRLQIQFNIGKTHNECHRLFTEAMMDDGIIPPQKYRPEHEPWRRPWYCTWADQVLLARTLEAEDDWTGQKMSNHVLDEDLVMRAARRIREWDLNVGTFVIDAGWQDKRGDWNPIEEKFPDMPALVARLHEMGFKVHFWWSPFQVEPGAKVLEREGFTYKLPGVNEYALDYTNPAVREYIGAKVDRWFSAGPGGWDIDGLKQDWQCERVQPVENPIDPDWRGEERCLYKMQKMMNDIAGRHKHACVISQGPVNPHFNNLAFHAGTGELFEDDQEFLVRSKPSLRTLLPGWWIKSHTTYFPETAGQHVRVTRALGKNSIPEIGTVLPENVTDEQMQAIKEALES